MAESDEKKFSLIHIDAGDWAKPANTLILKISNAIGILYEPVHIKRKAEAEAVVERIRTTAEIERAELLQRAAIRFLTEEAKKQANIESIIRKALPDVNESAEPEQVEDDWIANFFDKCRLISDDDMQKLWARILVGEANSPGKFSKRTVGLLASMDKADASKFTKVCDFSCEIETEIEPVIFNYTYPVYAQQELSYTLLSHLDTIGLIRFEITPKHYFSVNQIQQHTVVRYFGQEIPIHFPDSPANPSPGNYELPIGQVLFTDAGQQLTKICEAKPIPGFFEYLKQAWIILAPREGAGLPTSAKAENR